MPSAMIRETLAGGRRHSKNIAPVWHGAEYPLVTPGTYDMRCNKIQGPDHLRNYGRWSVRLECNFLMEEGSVSGFLNLGQRKQPHAGRESRYFRLWCQANGGPPKSGQPMSPEVFLGKFFRVRVETATTNSKGEPLSAPEQYSKITDFLECIGP